MKGRTCLEAFRKFENNDNRLFMLLILYVFLKYLLKKQRFLYFVIIGSSFRIPNIASKAIKDIYDENKELHEGRYVKKEVYKH